MNKNQAQTRKSIRLKKYDYSQSGWYYITICTQDRECILGNIVNGKMVLNKQGNIIQNVWQSLPKHHPVGLDVYQIMPNHLHGMMVITNFHHRRGLIHQTRDVIHQTRQFGQWMGMINHAPTLGHIIRYFKAKTSRLTNMKLWQRNYYEHIVRNETELEKIREYITLNPTMWDRDRNNLEKLN